MLIKFGYVKKNAEIRCRNEGRTSFMKQKSYKP
jgi:ribosomal protein L37E